MTSDEELQRRETARRKAFWTLASIAPGDPSAISILESLDDIELKEKQDSSTMAQALTEDELLSSVPAEPHPIGICIVREASIPQPWRERFLQASIGSTRVSEGLFAHDWSKFLVEWKRDIRHLEMHRAKSHKPG